MPKPADVMMTTAVFQKQYEVSKFLKIKPMALGILDILVALLGLGLTIWNKKYFLLCLPIIFIIIGAITVLAAHTCKPRLVKASQILSYINFAVVGFSLRYHFFFTWGVSCFLLISCDILIFIFSVAVASTSCSCCCEPKSRPVLVSYLNTDLPVNHIVLTGRSDSSGMAEPSSVLYMLLAADGRVPSASPPNYSPVPATPPPTYDQISATLLPNNGPFPSAPPPAYEARR